VHRGKEGISTPTPLRGQRGVLVLKKGGGKKDFNIQYYLRGEGVVYPTSPGKKQEAFPF